MDESDILNEYDVIQAEMMSEECIQVNAKDQVVGPVSKYIAHREKGVLHRAFSVLIFNNNNELLIQKRSLEKITFPGYWANSCCSHPLYIDGEMDTGTSNGVGMAAIIIFTVIGLIGLMFVKEKR